MNVLVHIDGILLNEPAGGQPQHPKWRTAFQGAFKGELGRMLADQPPPDYPHRWRSTELLEVMTSREPAAAPEDLGRCIAQAVFEDIGTGFRGFR